MTEMKKKRRSQSRRGDIDRQREAINAAVPGVRNTFIVFLLVGLYILLLTGSTTDEQLLRGSSLPLPFLNVTLPLIGAYSVAPILFVVLHVYLLLQIFLMARRIALFRANKQQPELLSQFFIVQMLIGNADVTIDLLIYYISRLTLVIGPVLILIFVQLRFLPYHNANVTQLHQFSIVADIIFVWILWKKITGQFRRPLSSIRDLQKRWKDYVPDIYFFILTIFLGWFVLFDAVIPNGSVRGLPQKGNLTDHLEPFAKRYLDISLSVLVMHSPPPEILAEYHRAGISGERAWIEYAEPLDLQSRDLRFAKFIDVRFTRTNLLRSDLRGADLSFAEFQGANLYEANLQRANLHNAKLQGAWLGNAHLEGANLSSTSLLGADLKGAHLQGALMNKVSAEGADFSNAQMQGADLEESNLFLASFAHADIQGADLSGTVISGVNLHGANLRGVKFTGAVLDGTDFQESIINLTEFTSAEVAVLPKNYFDELMNNVGNQVPEEIVDMSGKYRSIVTDRIKGNAARISSTKDTMDAVVIKQAKLFGPITRDMNVDHDRQQLTENWPPPSPDYSSKLWEFLATVPCQIKDNSTNTKISAEAIFTRLVDRLTDTKQSSVQNSGAQLLFKVSKTCDSLKEIDTSVTDKLMKLMSQKGGN